MKKNKKENKSKKIIFYSILILIGIVLAISFFYFGERILKIEQMERLIFLWVITILGYSITLVSGFSIKQADEKEFHAKASKKIKGAKMAIKLIKNEKQVNQIQLDLIATTFLLYAIILIFRLFLVLQMRYENNIAFIVCTILLIFILMIKSIIRKIVENYGTKIVETMGKVLQTVLVYK